ncbi:hypothetical protein ACTID9_27215 [Brevibacillus fluminis]
MSEPTIRKAVNVLEFLSQERRFSWKVSEQHSGGIMEVQTTNG